jgi:hypothetical protein
VLARPGLGKDVIMSTVHVVDEKLLTEGGDVLPEYHLDYSKSKPNHYAGRVRHGVTIRLDTDVAEVFSTDEAVNRALRAILQAFPEELKKAA